MPTIDIDGVDYEVSEDDYQAYMRDKAISETASAVINALLPAVEKIGEAQADALSKLPEFAGDIGKVLAKAIKSIKLPAAPEIPPIKIPDFPPTVINASQPKKLVVSGVKRGADNLIKGCEISIIY